MRRYIKAFALSFSTAVACSLLPGAGHAETAAAAVSIKNHRFKPAEVTVPANAPIALTVRNLDETAEEFESKLLRVERVIAGGAQTVFRLRPLNAGRYRFYGEYHEDTAEGVLVAK